jgi:hypothetical protein
MESLGRKSFEFQRCALSGAQPADVNLIEGNVDAGLRSVNDFGECVSGVEASAYQVFDMRSRNPAINGRAQDSSLEPLPVTLDF